MDWAADFNKDFYTKGLNAFPDSPLKDFLKIKLAGDAGMKK